MPEQDKIPFKHIAIEGVFKSGKTRLAKIFGERLGGQVVFDRAENPYLKDFYEEKEGTAFLAQLVYLVNRYHQQAGLLQRDLFAERVVCDYLFEKDKIYAYQTLTDDELIVYEKIYGIFLFSRNSKTSRSSVSRRIISPSTFLRLIRRRILLFPVKRLVAKETIKSQFDFSRSSRRSFIKEL